MNIVENVTQLVGNTPLIRLNAISDATGNTVLGKCEFLNPSSSVKDRLASEILHDAYKMNKIYEDTIIVEPTSGNTGIALASICAGYGLKAVLVMPDSMSVERRKLIAAYGAKIVLTPSKYGMAGSVEKAEQIVNEHKHAIMLQQFDNPSNIKAHIKTAQEILRDTDNKVDIFANVAGTSGTVVGVSKEFRKMGCKAKIFLVEPEESLMFSKNTASGHKIQGISPNFTPSIFEKNFIDFFVTVTYEDAINASRKLAQKEGLLVGISSGANLSAVEKIAMRHKGKGITIVTILCDTGERYLSTDLYEDVVPAMIKV